MQFVQNYRDVFAFLAGITCAVTAGWYFFGFGATTPATEDYHIHADVLMVINGDVLDLSAPTYMSNSTQELHEHVHFHDENDELIHVHAEGITLGEFYNSLGITLTNTCISPTASSTYCTNEANSLLLFVNGTPTTNIANYIPVDNDRLLLYYGDPTAAAITEYLTLVTDKACIYSGTCPERGIPPPESCGLTCEI